MAARSTTKEYRCWHRIIARCHNEDDSRYPWYGARGIAVCDEWRHSFDQFLADMGSAPSAAHTIERVKNHLGYHAENCRWATMKEQGNNRRSNVLLTFDGRTQTMAAWADELGVDRRVLWKRLKRPNARGRTKTLDEALRMGRKVSPDDLERSAA